MSNEPDIDDELDIGLDITNPPTDSGAVWQSPEDVWGDEIWDQKIGELLRQMPNGWQLIHVDNVWYCGRYVKGGDFTPNKLSAYGALSWAKERWG